MKRIGILASGRGSNAENICKYIQRFPEELQLVAVVTDTPGAQVVPRLGQWGVSVEEIPFQREGFASYIDAKKNHEQKILKTLQHHQVEWVCLAGYMRILSRGFLQEFYCKELAVSKVVNIHPSLLPSFPGRKGYEEAFAYGVKIYGVTLHLVDAGVDTGPILFQESLQREENDTWEDFQGRGLAAEYKVYQKFLEVLRKGELSLRKENDGGKFFVLASSKSI